MNGRPRVGISACLVGEAVRYDGGHKQDAALIDALGRVVEWVPFCPEVDAGFGVPRDPIRLVSAHAAAEEVAAITARGVDVTARLGGAATRLAREAEARRLDGFVLKSRSPSCGVDDAPVLDANGSPLRRGSGIFATALIARLPDLPVADEIALTESAAREWFLRRVLAYYARQLGR